MNVLRLARRARELGPGMVAFRVAQRLRRRAARARADLAGPRRPGRAEPPDWSRRAFFLSEGDRGPLRELLEGAFPAARGAILEEAEAALRGEVQLLTGERHAYGARVDWLRDPRAAVPGWPLAHFTRLDPLRLAEPCDIKIPWEVGRGTHLVRLAQAWWLTGEERFAAAAAAGIEDFTRENPPEFGPQWITPMEVALRLVHWIWVDRLCTGAAAFTPELRGRLWWGVREGARFIARFPERAPASGNHYWCDGLGLWYAGLFLGPSGGRLARLGRRITLGELAAQVHPDGVSFECSTGYHRLVTELMLHALRLAELEGEPAAAAVRDQVARMVGFTAETLHPGGRAPHLGDHDDGRVLPFAPRAPWDHRHLLAVGGVLLGRADWLAAGRGALDEAAWLAGPAAVRAALAGGAGAGAAGPRPAVAGFAQGGVYVLRAGEVHSVWDAGPLAKPGDGVHGHADTLSGEVSVAGVPVVVDSGTYAYTADPAARNRLRGTAAHNAVQLDRLEMAVPGEGEALWRFLGDVPCAVRRAGVEGPEAVLEASHDGYVDRVPGARVERAVRLELTGARLVVSDTVGGAGRHRVTLRWHLGPLEWRAGGEGEFVASAARRRVALGARVVRPAGGAAVPARLTAGEYSERWGELRPAPVLELEVVAELPVMFETVLTVDPPPAAAAGEAPAGARAGAERGTPGPGAGERGGR
ncbi:MAG TPA: alginate lyase family protein [Candidatus Saccharimonadales bacterium]|nr:alginate lyase family protein [Candidatus Saccharimonadales bacterium]